MERSEEKKKKDNTVTKTKSDPNSPTKSQKDEQATIFFLKKKQYMCISNKAM